MATKKAKTEKINDELTISWTDEQTAFKNSKTGEIVFRLPITMNGAWSDRRVARAINLAYTKGLESSSSTVQKVASHPKKPVVEPVPNKKEVVKSAIPGKKTNGSRNKG